MIQCVVTFLSYNTFVARPCFIGTLLLRYSLLWKYDLIRGRAVDSVMIITLTLNVYSHDHDTYANSSEMILYYVYI